jgi:putative ABC transport system ATP-binding protein
LPGGGKESNGGGGVRGVPRKGGRVVLGDASRDDGAGRTQDGRVRVFVTRKLTKVYGVGETAVQALRGIDLELFEGEVAVLLGPSGSGKSTLVNILGGLDVPSSGQAFFRGEELTALDTRALTLFRRRHVGFVFQFYNLIPSLTARENVALITDIAADPLPPEEALALVGLGERMDHFPAQLSGGEQQRVAVARAIAKRPEVLLCDEPTGALDSKTGVLVLEAIETVNRELQTTTVMITHNAAIAEMADRIVSLADGRISGVRENADKRPAEGLSW